MIGAADRHQAPCKLDIRQRTAGLGEIAGPKAAVVTGDGTFIVQAKELQLVAGVFSPSVICSQTGSPLNWLVSHKSSRYRLVFLFSAIAGISTKFP
jgi:hypothetical protein